MGFLKSSSQGPITLQTPPTQAQALTPVQSPVGAPPNRKRATSFLSDATLPSPNQPNAGGKTLLGQ